jgi:hypothetical protein
MNDTSLPSHAQRLSPWLKWYLPLAILLYPAVLIVPGLNWEANVYREYGLIETLSNVFLLLAFVLALRASLQTNDVLLRAWTILFALGCFVFLGEEMSWGQHYIKWIPPESWEAINRQNETNIHNIKGWPEFIFSKVIRNVLSIGAIVGSIIVPWWLRRNPSLCQQCSINFWLWPSSQTALIAVIAVTCNIPKRLAKNFGVQIPWEYYGPNDGELKECFFALFILLYALVLWRVVRNIHQASLAR